MELWPIRKDVANNLLENYDFGHSVLDSSGWDGERDRLTKVIFFEAEDGSAQSVKGTFTVTFERDTAMPIDVSAMIDGELVGNLTSSEPLASYYADVIGEHESDPAARQEGVQLVTVDQASDAMALYFAFMTTHDRPAAQEEWLDAVTTTGARYLMIEMAEQAENVLKLLPSEVQDLLLLDDDFYRIILDKFDFDCGVDVPSLASSDREIADEIAAEFEIRGPAR